MWSDCNETTILYNHANDVIVNMLSYGLQISANNNSNSYLQKGQICQIGEELECENQPQTNMTDSNQRATTVLQSDTYEFCGVTHICKGTIHPLPETLEQQHNSRTKLHKSTDGYINT